MSTQQIGIIGMATMGRNLALNIESKGYSISIFNRSREKTDALINEHPNKKIIAFYNIKTFILSLKKPRCIFMMIKAGNGIDEIIDLIKPFLNKGDILIDGGNAFYKDTIRRSISLSKEGFHFIDIGISGGKEGALKGTSIMLGGEKHIYKLLLPILKKIAAYADGEACVTYIGPNGSGHYVKMIHNGIEYADMQLIAESYILLKEGLKLNNEQLSDIFLEWNKGELNSYLIEITKNIFLKKEDNGKFIIDLVLDKANNKGTGKWISQSSLDLEEPLNMIAESVFARYLSCLKNQRLIASKILTGPKLQSIIHDKKNFIENVRRALYLGKIISYAQGFSQLKTSSERNILAIFS